MHNDTNTSTLAFVTPKRCLIAAFLFFLLMVGAGAIPGKAMAASAVVPDKLLHFVAYSVLSILLYCGMGGNRLSRGLRTFLLIGLLGGLDEGVQALMPYRNFDERDLEYDLLAAAVCISFLMLIHPTYAALAARRKQAGHPRRIDRKTET